MTPGFKPFKKIKVFINRKKKKKTKTKTAQKSNGDDSDISSFESVIAPQPIKKPKLVSLTPLSSALRIDLLRLWPVTFRRRKAGRGRIESAKFRLPWINKNVYIFLTNKYVITLVYSTWNYTKLTLFISYLFVAFQDPKSHLCFIPFLVCKGNIVSFKFSDYMHCQW